MGGYIEFNDTLQITNEQGFPRELDLEAAIFMGSSVLVLIYRWAFRKDNN